MTEYKSKWAGTSQEVQWLRVGFAMQGMWVRSLTRGLGSPCPEAAEPADGNWRVHVSRWKILHGATKIQELPLRPDAAK